MAKAQVTLHGRFSPGTPVRLIEADPGDLRADWSREVDTAETSKTGEINFKVSASGRRYFIVGFQNGSPLEVRVRSRSADDTDTVNSQPPVGYDRVRLSDGSWADETPARLERPELEAAPHLDMRMVGKNEVLRSYTPRGEAHPVEPGEPAPYGRQEDVGDGVVQMSDTETGSAHPVAPAAGRQEDVVAGTVQRSHTATGQAYPLPAGGPVKAQRDKESSAAKERRGQPVQAAAQPLDAEKHGRSRKRAVVSDSPVAPRDRDETSGLDAEGQPVDPAVARSAGVEPADRPAEFARRGRKRP